MTPAGAPLHVLHLEDSVLDHDLTLAELRRGGLRVQGLRVDSETAFVAALAQGGWDAVLSDFNVPGYGGLQALEQVRASGLGLPFILVSGAMGEDAAVAAMRNGAADYLLKHKLARLGPALEHAVAAWRERCARQSADLRLAESRQRLSELTQHLQVQVEAERAAIAREIHDDVGGTLTALGFELAGIARHADSPDVQQRVASALETLKQAHEAAKRIMQNLRPTILEQGLVPALQWMAGRFEKRSGIDCRFAAAEGASALLRSGIPLVAYRFAQEALTNIHKHAQASRVRMDLVLAAGVMSLEVADNGCGLCDADLARAGCFGLRGLHERAATVGGWVDVSSSAAGTVLLLSVPLKAVAAGAAGAADADAAHDARLWSAA